MERLTATRIERTFALPALAAAVFWMGRLVATNADGRGAPAADAPGLIVSGLIKKTVDNSAGAHGDKQVAYETGLFLLDNDPINPLTPSHLNRPCFIKDDITVSASPGAHNVFAGFFRGFNNNGSGVWLDTQLNGVLGQFFVSSPDSNFRFSAETATGVPIFQLWNQTQNTWQTVQIDGAPGAERLLIAAAS